MHHIIDLHACCRRLRNTTVRTTTTKTECAYKYKHLDITTSPLLKTAIMIKTFNHLHYLVSKSEANMPQTHLLLNASGEFTAPPPTALEAAVQRALLADELQKPGRASFNHV